MVPHILLIDDEVALRELYTVYFQMQGFKIRTAGNAVDALYEVYSHKFDLIILDLGLGDSNGINLIEPIKGIQSHTPIFIYTGNDGCDIIREEALKMGAARFLSKSYPLDYIANEVKRALAQSMAQAVRLSIQR